MNDGVEVYVDLDTFVNKVFNIIMESYGYFTVIENLGIIKVNQGLEKLGETTPIDMMMTNSIILKDCWLRYAKDISSKAYDQTDKVCVYYQLANFLLNPTSGKPTKFIDRQRVSEEAIYNFLKKTFPDLKMQDGVSTAMIDMIAKETKRNVYAYDFNDKLFFKNSENSTDRNYCPIIFYRGNGHMYLINTKEAFKSIVERNKMNDTTISTHNVEEKQKEQKEITVKHMTSFDGITCDSEECLDLEGGVYLLNRYSICNDVIKFIQHTNTIPRVKTQNNAITSMTFLNSSNQEVVIACDINYEKGNIVYEDLKNVATQNKIPYVNEGIGAVVSRIVSKQKKEKREYLDDSGRINLIKSFGGKCAVCNLESDLFEIDHIIPLCCGGSNELNNLQPLCPDCHQQKTEDERESGDYEENSDDPQEASFFNNNVFKNVVSTDWFKTWQFVEKVRDCPSDYASAVKKMDMNKCRRNLAYYSKYEFSVFSVMDTCLPFNLDDEIKVGSYYVETENTFPFRGSGWYQHPHIIVGLRDNVITRDNIKFKLEASKSLAKDHFQKNIDKLLEAFESEPKLQKLCVNTYIGLMGKTKYETNKTKFTLDKFEAANLLCEKNTFIIQHQLDEKTVLYQSKQKQDNIMDSTMYPIYAQILQMEALHLYETEKMIESFNGIVLERNTDSIRYIEMTPIDINQYFWDDEKHVQKYKWEDPKALMSEVKPRMKRSPDDNLGSTFKMDWKIEYDYDTNVETKAKEIVDRKQSIHIDGRAGTGKSFLTNKVIDVLKERGLNYICFSPTNKGARIIGGVTIDSMYYTLKKNKAAINKFKKVDYIIIDEVSMMQERFYNLFISIKKISPNTKYLVSGDFAQLPPVKDSWVGDYKNSAGLFELCDGNRLQLTKNRRSDSRLFDLAKNVETINLSEFPVLEKTYLNIAYKHETRKQVNQECLQRFLKEEADDEDIKLVIPANPKNPKTQDVTLTIGVPVVCHKTRNDKKQKTKGNGFLNSERFEVQYIEKDVITLVGSGDREVQIKASEFHKYFYIGFCITVHTSQGETLRDKYTIYDWDFFHFCEKAKYVAISRATSINNIQIF
jgi:5-methylcytosine-specific restriction endonuclease McrA/nucleoside-triphosphatase THEP1